MSDDDPELTVEEPSGAPEWIGRVVDDRYRIDRLLGEGGMGAVFVAESLARKELVAVKVILPRLAGNDELAQRFARESMVSAQLDHPHVASAIDSGTLPDGSAYLVMRLARGMALHEWMHERADWKVAVQLGVQIADALSAAHAKGIVHRDLKPENVMIEEREGTLHAVVLDFGLARLVGGAAGAAPLTRAGMIMGTPGYMPPEQALGDVVDARADVYALGVILWELVTGQELFEESELNAIVRTQLTMPRVHFQPERGVPAELEALIARMLDGSRANRPADGREVCDALRLVASRHGIALGSIPAVAAPTIDAPAISAKPREPGPAASRAAVNRGMLVAGLVALVVISALGARSGCSEDDGDLSTRTPVAPPALTPPVPPADGIPVALAADFAVVSTSTNGAARSAAAARLRAHQAELPEYARSIVAYASARDCEARREAVRSLGPLRDSRALPVLDEIARAARRDDRCLRRDLRRTIAMLRAPTETESAP